MTGMAMRRFRTAAAAAGPFGGGFAGNVDLGDIFGDLFGEMFNMGGTGSRRGSRVQRGRDLQYDLTLEFEQAVFGVEKEITIRRMETCADCKGSGAAKGKAAATCTQCGGRGQQRFQQGFFSVARTCYGVRRDGNADRRSVRDVPGRDAGADRTHDSGEGAGGRGAGYADTLLRARASRASSAGRRAICTSC